MGASFEDVLIVARHVQAALGALGLTGVPEDVRRDRRPDLRAGPARLVLRPGARLRRHARADDRARRSRARDDGVADLQAHRQGLHRPQHEPQRARTSRPRTRCAPRRGATASTPLTVGRGRRGRDAAGLPDRQRVGAVRRARRPVRGRADVAAGPGRRRSRRWACPQHEGVRGAETRRHRRTSEEVIAASKDPDLGEYLRKRTFGPEGTTEPPPGGAAGEGNSFVIHKHRATRLHYDVRLERDGALPSWAVPRGLPTRPGDKRLAVRTEDHPLEYGSFSGTIPEGHYGAGEVRIFDDGWYEPVEWTDSKVSFRLHGRRYPGLEYHVVKTRTDWLAFLASHQDAPLIPSPPAFPPMLAEGGWKAFDGDDWWFEPKFDGIRSVTPMATDATHLVTRNGRDVTDKYPELRMIHELVDQVNAVLDAEIVAFDEDGRNSFEALQQRMNLVERARDQADLEQDPGRAGRVRPAVARRSRPDRPRARGAARAARDDRRAGPPAPGGHPRRGRREGVRRGRPRTRPRGRGRQAHRLDVPARSALARLAQDQAHQHAGLRDPRVGRRVKAAGRGRSARCWSAPTTTGS